MSTANTTITPITSEFPTTATTTTTTTTTTEPTTASSTMGYSSTETTPDGVNAAMIGGIVGGVVGLILIILVVVFILYRRRRNNQSGKPPMLPDPYPDIRKTTSVSTSVLVENEISESGPTGLSADGLPMAPPPPVQHEPPDDDELYINQNPEEEDTQRDYTDPSVWQDPSDEGLYLPMSVNPVKNDLETIPTSREILSEYAQPDRSSPRPPACKGSINKGYVNVPNSKNVGTLPKYANLEKTKTEEEGEEEDYENVPGAKPQAASNVSTNSKSSRHLMPDILAKSSKTNSPRQKTSPKPQIKLHIPPSKHSSSSGSSSSSTPKTKNKGPPSPEGADYVNIKQYSKNQRRQKYTD